MERNKSTTIQDNSLQASALEAIVSKLLNFVKADFIFAATDNTTVHPVQILTILAEKEHLSTETYELADGLLKPYTSIRHRIFTLSYAEAAIKDYNLYFIQNCLLGELLYSNPFCQRTFYNEPLNTKKLLEGIMKYFTIEKEKINAFREGAEFYMQNVKYPQAAFTYQQTIELMFRTAGYFIMGKSLIAHSIESQQKYIKEFAPSLAKLFDLDNEQECSLLRLLDQSYLSVRYNNNFEITKNELKAISHKALLMDTKIEELFRINIREAKKKARNRNYYGNYQKQDAITIFPETSERGIIQEGTIIRETVPTPIIAPSGVAPPLQEELQQVICIIKGYMTIDAIYCFGYRKSIQTANSFGETVYGRDHMHYDLLVITHRTGQNVVADMSDTIYNKTNGKCTATILLHRLSWLEDPPEARRYFVCNILRDSELVYKKQNFNIDVPIEIPVRDMEALRKYWESRKMTAQVFLDAELTVRHPIRGQIQVAMLHQAVEHICLGLINTFLGYRPHHFALGYLFNLCENFSVLTADIFPRYTSEEKGLFKQIAANLSQLRQSEPMHTDPADVEALYEKSRNLYEQAVRLVDKELEDLSNR